MVTYAENEFARSTFFDEPMSAISIFESAEHLRAGSVVSEDETIPAELLEQLGLD